jgi:metal-responsive CopG/Arc/MetJ family transcriptional regulator
MPAKPVQISIDTRLLERIDADAETRQLGRSAFVRAAVERYLDSKARRQVDARIIAAYAGNARASLADIAELVEAQSWPDD